MLKAEARGLELLSEWVNTPAVINHGQANGWTYLLLSFVETGQRTAFFWDQLGRDLACLHRQTQATFGLEYDNYLGYLPQRNTPTKDWADFFVLHRLEPQLTQAIDRRLLWPSASRDFNRLYTRLPTLCPAEPPALVHGDLWAGNFMAGKDQQAVFIDPAPAYAHREMDLAMSRLFGGFDVRFYDAYQSAYPTAPGLAERLGVYQLYYLLAHVNLFGGGYTASVREKLQVYV